MARHMLTTIDNPFDPRTHFNEWNQWDMSAGYHTLSFLARMVLVSSELSDADQELAVETAIDEIVKENITGTYRKLEVLEKIT